MNIKLPSTIKPLKIGTRSSPLAVWQATQVRDNLSREFNLKNDAFEIHTINTSGDIFYDRPLREIGGKGLFTKEIEKALLDGKIDIAVHSMKDVPICQPPGLIIDTYLEREDPRDALVSFVSPSLSDFTDGAVFGTSSVRRKAQLLSLRPDLKVIDFRGNVQSRLKKLKVGVAAGTFLAMAGLNRLKVVDSAICPIDVEYMLPAVGQGVIGVERRLNDFDIAELLEKINNFESKVCLCCERAYLGALDGSCQTPIAGLAIINNGNVEFRGQILRPDGSESFIEFGKALLEDSEKLGLELAERVRSTASPDFFSWA